MTSVLRLALRRWPTGVIVATTAVDGVDFAMTANSLVSVCLDPPLVILSVERGTQFHDAVIHAGVWAATVLASDQSAIATELSYRGREPGHQLDGLAVRRGDSGLALIDGGLSYLECRVQSVIPGGDHDVLLSEVTAATWTENESARPLVYWGRSFHGLGDPPTDPGPDRSAS